MLKAIQMLPANEVIARLCTINRQNDDHDMRFYRQIASKLTHEKNGGGVVLVIQLAIYDYVEAEGLPPVIIAALFMNIPDYINALIDDEEVKSDAMATYEAIRGQEGG